MNHLKLENQYSLANKKSNYGVEIMNLPIALQLWSVRQDAENDIFKTLEKIAEMGFDGVEFAGYFGKTASELKTKLAELNLKVAGSHVGYEDIFNKTDEVIEFAKELGNKYIVCPYATFEEDAKWLDFIEKLVVVNEKIKQAGLTLLFHNHDEEFRKIDGNYIMDLILESVSMGEIDIYWVEYAEISAVDYLKQYSGRIPLVHIKDMAESRKESTEIGNGILDIVGIVAQAKASGAEWLILEQEAFTKAPLESVEIGLNNLKKMN